MVSGQGSVAVGMGIGARLTSSQGSRPGGNGVETFSKQPEKTTPASDAPQKSEVVRRREIARLMVSP
jgi:hypothetical protein